MIKVSEKTREKITVNEFVEKYNSFTNEADKKRVIKKIINSTYMSYALKILHADKIVQASCRPTIEVDGKKTVDTNNIKFNSAMQYVLFVTTVIHNYTDISISDDNILKEFDLLNEVGLVDEIFKALPEREISEFKSVLDYALSDFIANNYETKAFISNLVNKFATSISPMLDNLSEVIGSLDKEKVDGLVEKLQSLKSNE